MARLRMQDIFAPEKLVMSRSDFLTPQSEPLESYDYFTILSDISALLNVMCVIYLTTRVRTREK